MIWFRNSIAASCSNLKRSRTELLASISSPTRSGRLVSLLNDRIVRGLAVVDDAEVVLRQVLHKVVTLVGDGEDNVHLVNAFADGGQRNIVRLRWRRRSRRPARYCSRGCSGGSRLAGTAAVLLAGAVFAGA